MKDVFIIAEAGVNHDGKEAKAMEMIMAAKRCGADAIKFQSFRADLLAVADCPLAKYQSAKIREKGQLKMLEKLQLPAGAEKRLEQESRRQGIMFLSSPFDIASVDLLSGMGLDLIKIPSGQIDDIPYLRKIGRLKGKVLLSTGMSTRKEIHRALEVLMDEGTKRGDITLLHCVSQYPCPIEQANLLAIPALQKRFRTRVGYSDHTPGIEACIAAVALGASVIEKHFTLDCSARGPDHGASLNPNTFGKMVSAVRRIEAALGDGKKRPQPCELENKAIARKSIVAAKDIRKGERFTAASLTTKRPGTGIPASRWDRIIGKTAPRDFRKDDFIRL